VRDVGLDRLDEDVLRGLIPGGLRQESRRRTGRKDGVAPVKILGPPRGKRGVLDQLPSDALVRSSGLPLGEEALDLLLDELVALLELRLELRDESVTLLLQRRSARASPEP
jgi:hypothetical protein